jgi:hypothetical protein
MRVTLELPDELVDALAAALAQRMARRGAEAAEIVTTRDCGRYGLSRARFRELCASGELPASRVGNRYTARAGDVEEWIGRHRVEPRPEPATASAFDVDDPVERALSRGRLRVVRDR